MCGCYYYDDAIAGEIGELVTEIDRKLLRQRSGDIHPSELAPVLCKTGVSTETWHQQNVQIVPEMVKSISAHVAQKCSVHVRQMRWGFSQYQKSGLVINARAETALQRPMFCESVLHRRCVILARHFYEWDSGKNKVTFLRENGKVLYIAGFYNHIREEERFVILTTQANESVCGIHPRMPLILNENEWQEWIYDDHSLPRILGKTPDALKQYREYEQQSLF